MSMNSKITNAIDIISSRAARISTIIVRRPILSALIVSAAAIGIIDSCIRITSIIIAQTIA